MTSVGVIGLGLIGTALAHRLIATGDAPLVFDVKPEAVQAAVAVGAIAASSSAELAERCDVVLVCVQTDDQCIAAVCGEGGALERRTGHLHRRALDGIAVDHRKPGRDGRRPGVPLVDTPVAGRGMFSVEDGTVSVMVGDDGELVTLLEPTLRRFASKVVAAGRLGSGAALKLAHNIVVYAGFAAMMEAVELARAAGVRDGLVEEVAQASGALSELSAFTLPFYKHFRDDPHGADEDEILRVAAALLEKDLADAVALAALHGVDVPVARLLSHFGDAIFQVKR